LNNGKSVQTPDFKKLEAIGDMSRVTLNFDLSKIPFVHF